MSSCPEDLVARSLRGGLSQEQSRVLSAHVERCEECRSALAIAKDFDSVLGARAGDEEIASRIASSLTEEPRRRWRPGVFAWAAIFFGVAGAAATTHPVVRRAINELLVLEPEKSVESAQPKAPVLRPVESIAPAPAQPDPVEPEVQPPAESESVATSRSSSSPPQEPAPSSSEPAGPDALFRGANSHRRSGEFQAARSAYERLIAMYPSSTEALVARVSLGRMIKSSAPGVALGHFNAYLSQSRHTTLVEEALYGKASTLSALGRRSEEVRTWKSLLSRFPSSVYAERAQRALDIKD